jgi:hypothetical protein
MDRPSLYDDDIVTWAEEQAAALRALAERPDLSNAVDWENVAEEIESVGRSQVRAVESLLIQVLAHLLKQASAPIAPAISHWRQETLTFQQAAYLRFEPSMRRRLCWDQIWAIARTNAEANLLVYGQELLPDLPSICPVPPEALLTSRFDLDGVLNAIVGTVER